MFILFYRDNELKAKASLCFLETLIPIVTYTLAFENGAGFSKMFAQMVRLADYAGRTGHVKLFKASVKFLDTIKSWLNLNIKLTYLQTTDSKPTYPPIVIASSCVMNYVSDVISAIENIACEGVLSRPSLDSMSLFYYDAMELDGFLPCNDGDTEASNEDSVSIYTLYNIIIILVYLCI